MPGPLSPRGAPRTRSRRERFDRTVVGVVSALQAAWPRDLADVEFGVEDVPWVDDDWWPAQIPLSALVSRTSRRPARIVVYRLPIQAQARRHGGGSERELVYAVLVERVCELLDRPIVEVDPRSG